MAGVSSKSGRKRGGKDGPHSLRKDPERDAAIVAAYRQMGSLRQVAKGFKISPQRVSQIVRGQGDMLGVTPRAGGGKLATGSTTSES